MPANRPSTPASPQRFSLLGPAAALLNRLRYGQKFALIGALIFVPLAAVTYLQISAATTSIVFNQRESEGLRYVEAAREMLRALHRFDIYHTLTLSGDTSFAQDLRQASAKVDEAVAGVDTIDAASGATLGTTAQWTTIKQEWASLRQGVFTVDAAEEARDKLRSRVRELVFVIGNSSNLTLDPDVDSYWLQDSALASLVQLTETVQKISLAGFRTAALPQLTDSDRLQLAGLHRVADTQLRTIVDSNFKASFQANSSGAVKQALLETLQKTDQALSDHLKWVRDSLLSSTGARPTPSEVRTRGQAALDQLYLLQQKVAPILDTLIQARVSRYQAARRQGILVALAAIGLLAYLFAAFYRSVQQAVSQLGAFTDRMIAGTDESFRLESQDEVGDIAVSYNSINRALVEARSLKANVERENQLLQGNVLSLLQVVSEAADGSLTVRAPVTAGALGNVSDAFNQMMESWQVAVKEIQEVFARTNEAVSAIEGTAESMAKGAATQVDAIVAASQSFAKVQEGIARVSETAQTASVAARRAQQSAEDGTKSVDQVVRGMDGLRTNVQAGAKKIKTLGDRSMEITSIVGTIAKISDQTNMLALNAAIEAARAGEHGRGFSVVADQVRQLAERTASATQEIEALVRAIQTETNESVDAIEQQTAVVEEESKIVGQAGHALTRIQEVSTQSAALIGDIEAIVSQQVAGVASVGAVMSEVSLIAEGTRSGADSSLTRARELAVLSGDLMKTISRFNAA